MVHDNDKRVRYLAGLSLGPPGMFTGLAVLEKHCRVSEFGNDLDRSYAVRHLARFPPGAPYALVAEALREVFADPPINGGSLVVDQTGVGRAVFESVQAARVGACLQGITVTAGHAAEYDNRGGWLVPKKDLVGVMQILLQEKRIKVSPALEHAATLAAELQQFQMKAVSLDPAAVEWRERPHDDLVLAVTCAAWQAERQGLGFFVAFLSIPDPEPPRWLSRW